MSYFTMGLLTLQLFKNRIDTQEKLRLNLHSLSVSELLECGRKCFTRSLTQFKILVCTRQLQGSYYTGCSGRSFLFN